MTSKPHKNRVELTGTMKDLTVNEAMTFGRFTVVTEITFDNPRTGQPDTAKQFHTCKSFDTVLIAALSGASQDATVATSVSKPKAVKPSISPPLSPVKYTSHNRQWGRLTR